MNNIGLVVIVAGKLRADVLDILRIPEIESKVQRNQSAKASCSSLNFYVLVAEVWDVTTAPRMLD